MPVDNRQTPRIAVSIPVTLRFSTGKFKEGWGRIISLNNAGLYLESRFTLKVAQVVYVTFSLREGSRFENLRARVIRSAYQDGYYSAGIAFDEVVDKETLRDVLSALAFEAGVRFE